MPDAVTESGAFIGPLTWSSVPAKSTISRSAVFLTDKRMRNGASRPLASSAIPSPSQKSSNTPSPSAKSISVARIRGANVRQNEPFEIDIERATADEPQRRHAQSFAEDLRHRAVAAGRGGADVRPVRAQAAK